MTYLQNMFQNLFWVVTKKSYVKIIRHNYDFKLLGVFVKKLHDITDKRTVNHAKGEYTRDDDGDGKREVHVNGRLWVFVKTLA